MAKVTNLNGDPVYSAVAGDILKVTGRLLYNSTPVADALMRFYRQRSGQLPEKIDEKYSDTNGEALTNYTVVDDDKPRIRFKIDAVVNNRIVAEGYSNWIDVTEVPALVVQEIDLLQLADLYNVAKTTNLQIKKYDTLQTIDAYAINIMSKVIGASQTDTLSPLDQYSIHLQNRPPPLELSIQDTLGLSDQHSISFETQTSGLDPNDPLWAPWDGWDEVIEFTSEDDLNWFDDVNGAVVEDGLCKLEPPIGSGETYKIWKGGSFERAAVCFFYIEKTADSNTQYVAYLYSLKDLLGMGAELGHHFQPAYTYITDIHGGTTTDIGDRRGKWLVFLIDHSGEWAKVYEGNSLIHQESLATYEHPSPWIPPPYSPGIGCYGIDNQPRCHWTYVDWIAVKWG